MSGSPVPTTPVVHRRKERVFVPPRRDVRVPGMRPFFSRGFLHRLRKSQEGLWLIPVLIVGAAVLLLGLAGTVGPFRERLQANTDPRFFLAALGLGAAFFLIPLRMLYAALDSAARGDRKGDRSDPWTWDHPWSTEWMKPDYVAGAGGIGTFAGRALLLAFLGMLNVVWDSDSWWLKGIVAVLDLFAVLLLYDSLRKLVQWLRFRHSVVIWSAVPVFPGERLQGRIAFARTLRVTGAPRVTLRCMEDRWVLVTDQGRERQLLPFALYQEMHELPAPESGTLDALDISIQVPFNLPGTDLASEEATYWQVAIDVPLAGPNLEEVFLAPIYKPEGRKSGARNAAPQAGARRERGARRRK